MKFLSIKIVILFVLLFPACESDNCKDLACQNNGTCFEGKCLCAAGFEGDLCEKSIADKFVGSYILIEGNQCDSNAIIPPLITIEKGDFWNQELQQELIVLRENIGISKVFMQYQDGFYIKRSNYLGNGKFEFISDLFIIKNDSILEVFQYMDIKDPLGRQIEFIHSCLYSYTKQ